jgi:hypothetical protein
VPEFLYLAHGAKGLHFYTYDGGVWSNGQRHFGLVFNQPWDSGGDIFYSPRYFAVNNRIAPLLMDTVSGWGPLLMGLEWRGAGPADVPDTTRGSVVTDFRSSITDPETSPYVQLGFFEDDASLANYILVVNRRTPDSLPQQVALTVDAPSLLAGSRTHYYLVDLNPQDSILDADTTLVGPINNEFVINTSILPGGVKFFRITAAPEYITGNSFPLKWWGRIEAKEELLLSSGNTMRLAPPLELTIHTHCGPPTDPVRFKIEGQLVAQGKADSVLVFKHAYDGPPPVGSCSGVDSIHWSGLAFAGSAACSLSYCNILNADEAVLNSAGPGLYLDHVTTSGTQSYACRLTPAYGDVTLSHCTFDAAVRATFGQLTIKNCKFDSAATAIEAVGTGSDSLIVERTRIVAAEDIGIYIDNYPARLLLCSLWHAEIGVQVKDADLRLDTLYTYQCGHGLVVDTGASVAGTKLRTVGTDVGMLVRQGSVELSGATFSGADTCVVSDAGTGNTVQLEDVFAITSVSKGITTRSGTLILDSCTMFADSSSCIDAYTGSTVVRVQGGGYRGSPSSAAISIGPGARLVASGVSVGESYIGMEIKGDGADSVMGCHLWYNSYYGLWFADGDAVDYSYGNYITGDTSNSPSIGTGYYAYRQSVESTADTVDGYYGCLFKYFGVGSSSATVNGLVAIGASPDATGMSLQGTSSDTAVVHGSKVNEDFNSIHAYLYGLRVDIEECEFVSTGVPQTSAYYGIYDQGYTSGRIACTKVLDQKYACIGRSDGSTIDYGDANQAEGLSGENSIYVTDSAGYASCKYFWNFAYDTVKAEDNWWGHYNPPSSRFAGPIDRIPRLTTTPDCQGEGGGESKIALTVDVPREFALDQNYPNPFNPGTTIEFSLPAEQPVRLDLFNVIGQRVRAFDLGLVPAGRRSVYWNGRNQGGIPVGS